MKRRNFIAFVGAVCAFPTALFAKAKSSEKIKGKFAYLPRSSSDLLTEAKLNHCLDLWGSHRTKRPTIVLLSIANMENLMQDRYGPNWVKFDGIPTEVLQSFGCCPECSGRPPLLLQTRIDQGDHFIVIGRSERDEDAMPIFLKKSDRSKRLILTGITEPAFEMIA